MTSGRMSACNVPNISIVKVSGGAGANTELKLVKIEINRSVLLISDTCGCGDPWPYCCEINSITETKRMSVCFIEKNMRKKSRKYCESEKGRNHISPMAREKERVF
ncbi:hypothetical protein [Hespellia stercorisuis]|uniref:hypothetical protein n=1 Tax=Hespellia stercorisuis TaxID=180311 RepID=UPI0011607583|nr:hypothetical protein [Hespellia stercorisuis]